ncbi:MAG: polymer-forming cytoskeletal protein [Alphaproteobacteria bacterium]|nr:polymer-forming cytoskeletal protein [Alphaproteobacteria bacterium]
MINSGEPVEVRGFVDGSIVAPSVVTTPQSMVVGDIVATEVIVAGRVSGNIFADKLVLEASCDVDGEIYHGELVLNQGAHFEGKSRNHPKPKSLAPAFSLTDLSIPS